MVSTYQPLKDYFTPRRLQLTGKEIIKECAEDRQRALKSFDFFKKMVDSNPEDDKAKSEMVKTLELSMSANDKKVKLLDLMVKLAMHREKLRPKESVARDVANFTFEDLKDVAG